MTADDPTDPEYRFDLTDVFTTRADCEAALAEVEADLDEFRAEVEAFDPAAASRDGPFETLSDLLASYADLVRQVQRVDVYTQQLANTNTHDDEAAGLSRRATDLAADREAAAAALTRTLARSADALDPDALDDPDHRAFVADCLRRADHVQPPAVEDALATLDDAFGTAGRVVTAVKNEDFDPGTVEGPDGEPVEVTLQNRSRHYRSPDRDFRRRVHRAVCDSFVDSKGAISRAVVDRAREQVALAEVREYDSARAMALDGEGYPETGLHVPLDPAIHETLLDGVQSNLDPLHRADELRREQVRDRSENPGADLRPWDTNVPLAGGDPDLTYDQARAHVVAAMEPLGEAYQDRVREILHDRRVDVHPREGKRSDIPAYCPFGYDTGPFVLLNFQRDVTTTFYLAHELGHAAQQTLLAEERGPLGTTIGRIHEVNSILHELLLADHLLSVAGNRGDDEVRGAVLDRLVQTVGGNLYGSTRHGLFEHRVFELVADGEDPGFDRLSDRYTAVRETFQPAVVPDEGDRRDTGWLAGAYNRPAYHLYDYALGVAGALAAHQQLQDGDLTPAGHREFLVGGRAGDDPFDPVSAFESLGLDVTSERPYAIAAEAYGEYVEAAAAFGQSEW